MITRSLFCLLFLTVFKGLSAQNIDTLISGIEYFLIRDTSSKLETYTCVIKNKSNEVFKTDRFEINSNKMIVKNPIGEKMGYDMIFCGNLEQILIQPDCSYSWNVKLFELIPGTHPLISREAHVRLVDSTYLIYWSVNQNLIGPIEYYIEKDLVTNLYDYDNFVRSRSAEFLRSLFDKGLTTVKPGHSKEHTLAFWEEKFAPLKEGMNYKEVKKMIAENCESCRWPRLKVSRTVKIQLDNSYQLLLPFEVSNYLSEHSVIYNPKLASDRTDFGSVIRNSYFYFYVNGQAFNSRISSSDKKDGNYSLFNHDGTLISKSIYKNGIEMSAAHYHPSGALSFETTYLDAKRVRFIQYDESENIISDEIINYQSEKKRKKKKRRYK